MLCAGKIKNRSIDRQSYSHGSKFDKLPMVAAASQIAAAAGNEGGIFYDETSNTLYFSDGTSWAAVGAAAALSLQGAFANGKLISGANSNANRFEVGDGTRDLFVYGDGTDVQVGSQAGDIIIVPAGGNVSITGNFDVSGTLNITGEIVVGSGAASAKITSSGAYDLVIDTNEGTNSGSITITDGVDGDIDIAANGAGSVKIADAAIVYKQRDVAAGTLTDSPDANDGLVQIATDGANDCVVTLPEAASNLGLVLTFQHDVDGGNDVVLTRTGADTLDEDADTGNVTCTLANAGECIQIMAVADNIWMIVSRVGGTLA